jgi:hypothetical protein
METSYTKGPYLGGADSSPHSQSGILLKSQVTTKKAGDKKEKAQKAIATKKWAWNLTPPKEGDSKIRNCEGKTYNWCMNYAVCTVHMAAECKIEPGMAPPKKGYMDDKAKKVLALSQAFQSIMDAQDNEDSNEEADGDSVFACE